MKKPWWNFWKKEQSVEVVAKELLISEPVKTIANLMIRNRKRFVIGKFNSGLSFAASGYNILVLETGEEFRVSVSYNYMSEYVIGPVMGERSRNNVGLSKSNRSLLWAF